MDKDTPTAPAARFDLGPVCHPCMAPPPVKPRVMRFITAWTSIEYLVCCRVLYDESGRRPLFGGAGQFWKPGSAGEGR